MAAPSLGTLWDHGYFPYALPPLLPYTRWSAPAGPREFFPFGTLHLEAIPAADIPTITVKLLQDTLPAAFLDQYISGKVEAISRRLIYPPAVIALGDFVWTNSPPPSIPAGLHTKPYGWVLGLRPEFGFLLNLVTGSSKSFDTFVNAVLVIEAASVTYGIGTAAAAEAGAGASASSTAGGAAAGSTAAAGGASAAAGSGAAAAAGNASSAAASSTGTILDSVKGVVADLKDTVKSVLSPISDTLHQVSSLVTDINENLIKPITGPITSILDNYKSLQGQLQRDLSQGVAGLLRVPTDIANALSSVDATVQRSISTLGAVNRSVIHEELGPGVGAGLVIGAESTRASINAGLDEYHRSERDDMVRKLHNDPGVESIAELEAKILRWTNTEFPVVGKIGGVIIDALTSSLLLLSYLEAKKDAFGHIGKQKWPTTPLDATTALEALRRGILSDESADEELSKAGLDSTRRKVLKELDRKLPAEGDILDWEARKIISADDRIALFSMLGWREDDAAKARVAHEKLPDPAQAVDWYFRGRLGREELQDILEAYDFRFADTLRIVEMAVKLPQVGDVFARYDRQSAIDANVAPSSLTREAPADVAAQLWQQGISPDLAALLWVNHFTLLGPADAVQAWFRGYLSLDQLHACLRAAGLVPEQWQNYIDLQRPVFTVRNVPTLLKAEIINAQQAMDELRAIGYADVDADRMVRWALGSKKAPTVAQADTLHGLTAGAIEQLYDAGAIERVQAQSLLVGSGMGEEAAQLTLTLRDIKNHTAERAAESELVVAQALSGHFTFDQAQSQLEQLGLTTQETAKALGKLTAGLTARTKLPSEAQTMDLYAHGLISRVVAAQILGLLGFSEAWAELLIQLKEAGKNASPTNA